MIQTSDALSASQSLNSQNTRNLSPNNPALLGSFLNTPVAKTPNLSQLIQDMQEEISFAHSETQETHDVEEENIHDRRDHQVERLVLAVREKHNADDPSQNPQHRKLRSLLARGRITSEKSLQDAVDILSQGDKSLAASLLQDLVDNPPENLDHNSQTLIANTRNSFFKLNVAPIQAGLNVHNLALQTSQKHNLPLHNLQRAYQDVAASYNGVLPAMRTLAHSVPQHQYEVAGNFIMHAAAQDLASTVTSIQPYRLQHIISELQGLKVLNTIHEQTQLTLKRHAQRNPQSNLQSHNWTLRTIDALHDPNSFSSQLRQPLQSLNPTQQTLFLQDVRSTCRAVPDWLFPSPQAKTRALYPIQSELDSLILKHNA